LNSILKEGFEKKNRGFAVQFVALRKRSFAKGRLAAEIRLSVQFCTNRVVTPTTTAA
jgi:hypothetical protein